MRLSHEDVQAAMNYYTKDELKCSQQSPNKKEVIGFISKRQKLYVSKRFMNRSIRKTFRLFKKKPENKIKCLLDSLVGARVSKNKFQEKNN